MSGRLRAESKQKEMREKGTNVKGGSADSVVVGLEGGTKQGKG